MRRAAIVSAGVHLAILAVIVFGLPEFTKPLPTPEEPASVEVIDLVTDVANPPPPQRVKSVVPPQPTTKPLPPAPQVSEASPPPAVQPPVPEPAPAPPPPAPAPAPVPPPVEAKPAPSAPPKVAEAPPPDPVKSEVPLPTPAKPQPEKPQPPKTAEKPVEKPPEKPPEKPVEKPAKPTPPKPKDVLADLDSVLDSKATQKPQKPAKPAPAKPAKSADPLADLDSVLGTTPAGAPPPPNAQVSDKPNKQVTAGVSNKPLSMSEKDAIVSALQSCWNVDPGLMGVGSMAVKLHVFLNRDGSLNGNPEIVSDRSRLSEPAYRSFADSAYRAFFKCRTLPVPADKFDSWNEMYVTFTPNGMKLSGG